MDRGRFVTSATFRINLNFGAIIEAEGKRNPQPFFLAGPDAEITISTALLDGKLPRPPTWGSAFSNMWVVFKFFHVVLLPVILVSTMFSECFGDSSFPDYGSVKDG